MARKLVLGLLLLAVGGCGLLPYDVGNYVILPEQRTIPYRDPEEFAPGAIPISAAPRTVSDTRPDTPVWPLSLDDAIRIALENARVIRILAGTTAVASGQTIYDAAIVNTTIDQAQATFDPVAKWNNTFSRTNTPLGSFVAPGAPPPLGLSSFITSNPVDVYTSDLNFSQTNVLGGMLAFDWTQNHDRIATPGPFPLNPQDAGLVTLSYTQPLLQGSGFALNTAPIAIARLNTEQSFYQYKDTVQQLVVGTVSAYWNLVQGRVNAWARKIQEQQSKEAYDRESARLKTGFSDVGTVSQARVTYHQFRANRVAADADVLTREGALRNLLGLPPDDDRQIVPTSAPAGQRLTRNWETLVRIAEQHRPDILELKIVTEADQVRLVQAENQMLPRLDAVTAYQWNSLSGQTPLATEIATSGGQYPNWSLGLNFTVPLGLRQGRALTRQQKLLIVRDKINLDQQVHLAIHQIAATVRDLDSAYEQYLAFKETREAADINLRVQTEKFRTGQSIYLNVLQALNDWGNAVSSEAQQLLLYNVSLAALEQETGTILETHGLVFAEEHARFAGPLMCTDRCYPAAHPPQGAPSSYPSSGAPSEDTFDLRNPATREGQKEPEKSNN